MRSRRAWLCQIFWDRPSEGPCLVRACKYVCDLVNVLLRGVGRILVLLTGHRQAGLLRNGNSTRCGACGCVKRDFSSTGRATASIALGMQGEKRSFTRAGEKG